MCVFIKVCSGTQGPSGQRQQMPCLHLVDAAAHNVYCFVRTGTHLRGSSHHDSNDVYMTFATRVFNNGPAVARVADTSH
jgi:hypothetical protein